MENKEQMKKDVNPMEEKDDKKKKFIPIEARLRAVVAAKGMTLAGLAKNIGVDPASIQSFMKRDCSLSTLYLIAKGLEVEVSDLFDVPEGYVHFDVNSNTLAAKNDTQKDDVANNQSSPNQSQPLFCPHCGQKFVMLPRED